MIQIIVRNLNIYTRNCDTTSLSKSSNKMKMNQFMNQNQGNHLGEKRKGTTVTLYTGNKKVQPDYSFKKALCIVLVGTSLINTYLRNEYKNNFFSDKIKIKKKTNKGKSNNCINLDLIPPLKDNDILFYFVLKEICIEIYSNYKIRIHQKITQSKTESFYFLKMF